ncbi:hypothetical protein GCM10010168_28530 [Actinoplanes ianthinogenes]|uniref:GGDEF domain-containing protein n=2 Tax=Actinoplanes ianthinogenes TaxID=122358 RepID=A0ABM7LL98_9ACTN|nr:hypothetical protein Aiant_06520 [Actinoplanes ianthinogenes]GGR09537.1 hypothetical protein GCM10010168_28530 [Actinoplanes ianthinogenes]
MVVAAIGLAGFLAVPDDSTLQLIWQVGCGWFAAAMIAVGVRRTRSAMAASWWLFALGVAGNSGGILVEYILTRTQLNPGFPSWADAAYLSLYPAVAAGMFLLIRRRAAHRDWSSLVDATTLTTGVGLLAWVFMVKPAASDPTIGLLGHIVSVAYPLGDVVLLAMTVRLLLSGGRHNGSFRLVSAALICFLAGDGTWAVINQMAWEPGPMAHRVLADVFLAGYLLFGAAAVHQDARSLARTVAPRPARISRPLLAALTFASLIGPGLLIVQATQHRVTDVLSIAVGCAALFLLVVTRMSQLLTQLDVQTEKARELAVTDELTGLPNRRAWNTELPRGIERARRSGSPVTVAVIDIDHFKKFNDAYGHPAGDRLLKEAAAAWLAQSREVDHLARYGGEEFVLMLPDATVDQAREIVDRMRLATPLGQTFSAGVAQWDGTETSDELTARADSALYVAKADGRNRIAVPVQ